MAMTFNLPLNNFDQDTTFTFVYKSLRGQDRTATGYLFNSKDEGVIYILQKSACLKGSYTTKMPKNAPA